MPTDTTSLFDAALIDASKGHHEGLPDEIAYTVTLIAGPKGGASQ